MIKNDFYILSVDGQGASKVEGPHTLEEVKEIVKTNTDPFARAVEMSIGGNMAEEGYWEIASINHLEYLKKVATLGRPK